MWLIKAAEIVLQLLYSLLCGTASNTHIPQFWAQANAYAVQVTVTMCTGVTLTDMLAMPMFLLAIVADASHQHIQMVMCAFMCQTPDRLLSVETISALSIHVAMKIARIFMQQLAT